jgi:hypothetical protein
VLGDPPLSGLSLGSGLSAGSGLSTAPGLSIFGFALELGVGDATLASGDEERIVMCCVPTNANATTAAEMAPVRARTADGFMPDKRVRVQLYPYQASDARI